MKVILLIDVPEDVGDVTCIYTDRYGFTQQAFYQVKPTPKKKNTDFSPNIVYANGWNACLEKITGETE